MRILIACFVLLTNLLSSCKEEATVPDATLQGRWRFTETYSSPGFGNGNWTPIQGMQFVTFNNDGTMNGGDVLPFAYFTVVDGNKIIFRNQGSPEIQYRYKITGKTLELYPPCYEGCGLRFVKQ